MKMRSWCRKALSFTASFLFMVLLFTVPASAEVIPAEDILYIPVTIHDYAADGMLFEWNNLTGAGVTDVNGKTVYQGNNNGFGLLETNEDSHQNSLGEGTIAGSAVQINGEPDASENPDPKTITLSNNIKETIYGGTFRTGLVEPVLGPDRKPVYRKETVDFLAGYLSETLPENLSNEDGSEKLWYVMGTKLDELGGQDLADTLRTQLINADSSKFNMGSYENSKKKAEAGGLQSIYDATSYYDAAYFLLADLFRDSTGYGQTIEDYDEIMLIKDNDQGLFTFYSGYTDTDYNKNTRVISNNQIQTIDSQGTEYGFQIPEDIFNPLEGIGYGNQNNPYQIYMGGPETDDVNHNLTLESHGEFIYHEAENQYFNFTGDDDAYLYLNGILVIDMGGSHPISKAGVELNAIAERLGLIDGEMYDFDFFYMDRQGKNADFGIETNIRLQNPALVTDIKAFQNQRYVGYGGSVDPEQPVTYQFSVENRSDRPITNISFRNDDIQIDFNYQALSSAHIESVEDVLIERRNVDGSDDVKIKIDDYQRFTELLEEGLEPGQKLIIYGIKHQITEEEWNWDEDQQKDYFPVVLLTEATVADTSARLFGCAQSLVAKNSYTFVQNHYYDWGKLAKVVTEDEKDPDVLAGNDGRYALEESSAGVSMTREELLQTAVDAGAISNNTESTQYCNAKIKICSYTGSTELSNNLNSHAVVQEDGSVFYQTDKTGMDTFYYLVESGKETVGPIAVDVYTYGISNNTYVLDYGLSVELYDDENAGLTNNDLLSMASVNPAETEITLSGIKDSKATYGTFTQKENSLIYQPKKIMDGADEATIELQILEKGAECLTPKTGILLSQTITVVPASVVYYEDNFEGLTYISDDGNAWAMYEGFDENGNSTAGEFQSSDQDSNYGSDPNYELDHEGTLTLVEDADGDGECDLSENELARYEESIYGDASNDTIHVLNVQETADVLSFTFAGTGFDIVSRTTTEAYSVLSVTVTDSETGTVVKQFPVITECKNGDLYQVPVISVKDLTYGTYQITLRAAKSKTTKTDGKERILYIDGVRIYGPLDYQDRQLYYGMDEKNMYYYEMKSLIQEGRALMITQGPDKSILTGSTFIEDVDEYGFILKDTSSVDEYLKAGPNNEIYLNSAAQNNALVILLRDIPEQEKSIQIGVHRKSDESTGSYGAVNLVYGCSLDELEREEHVLTIESGTENYYDIDVEYLQKCADGYLLMVGTTESENDDEILALTNMKFSGYEPWTIPLSLFENVDRPGSDESYSESMDELDGIARLKDNLYHLLQEPEVEPTLVLESLKFKNEKVASGKTATLLVVSDTNTDAVVVMDQDGREVEFSKNILKEKNDKHTFTLSWKVDGTSGEVLTYTVFGKNEGGVVTQKETITLDIK